MFRFRAEGSPRPEPETPWLPRVPKALRSYIHVVCCTRILLAGSGPKACRFSGLRAPGDYRVLGWLRIQNGCLPQSRTSITENVVLSCSSRIAGLREAGAGTASRGDEFFNTGMELRVFGHEVPFPCEFCFSSGALRPFVLGRANFGVEGFLDLRCKMYC